MKKNIIPSIIAKNQKELDKLLNKIKGLTKNVHLDIMDGVFVPNKSLDFNFVLPESFEYEAHLMVMNPDEWIDKLIKHKKIKTIIIHYESKKTHTIETVIHLKKHKKKISLAINPKTSVSKIKPYLSVIDKVTVMDVEPGFYGSKFKLNTLEKEKELRRLKKGLNIEVDGGINPTTLKKTCQMGANIFVTGSYVMKDSHPKKALTKLKNVLKKVVKK